MATIKLGKRPESFKKLVKFTFLDGTEGRITVDYKWRTRREFQAFLDQHFKPVEGTDEAAAVAALDVVGANARYLAEILVGWDIESKLTPESLEQFADELPAACQAVIASYALAINEGRLGN